MTSTLPPVASADDASEHSKIVENELEAAIKSKDFLKVMFMNF